MENAIQTELSKNGVYLIKLNRPEVLNECHEQRLDNGFIGDHERNKR